VDAKWPRDWKEDDVVGCAIDFEGKKMRFSLNGFWVDEAMMEFELGDRSIFPALTMTGDFALNIPRSTWTFRAPDSSYVEWSSSGVYKRPYTKELEKPLEIKKATTPSLSADDSEAVKAEKAAKADLQKHEDQHDQLQQKLDALGDDKLGFATLADQTLEKHSGEHNYKVTFFDEAEQEYTSLGTWEGWTGPLTAKFSNGQHCWQGPARSLLLTFECGLDAELKDIAEPSRCVYEATVVHPGACDEKELEQMDAPRVAGPKDEL